MNAVSRAVVQLGIFHEVVVGVIINTVAREVTTAGYGVEANVKMAVGDPDRISRMIIAAKGDYRIVIHGGTGRAPRIYAIELYVTYRAAAFANNKHLHKS